MTGEEKKDMKTTQETNQKKLPETAGITRDKQGKFIKGVSGNPAGKPVGSGLNLTSLLKEHLESVPEGQKTPYKDLFIKTLLKKALIDKDIQALKLIINYVDGLPVATIKGDPENPLNFKLNIETEKKINEIIDEL